MSIVSGRKCFQDRVSKVRFRNLGTESIARVLRQVADEQVGSQIQIFCERGLQDASLHLQPFPNFRPLKSVLNEIEASDPAYLFSEHPHNTVALRPAVRAVLDQRVKPVRIPSAPLNITLSMLWSAQAGKARKQSLEIHRTGVSTSPWPRAEAYESTKSRSLIAAIVAILSTMKYPADLLLTPGFGGRGYHLELSALEKE